MELAAGSGGRRLGPTATELPNAVSHEPAWILVSEQLLQRYLASDFGDTSVDRIMVRAVASFEKPGGRAQLGLYEVTRPK